MSLQLDALTVSVADIRVCKDLSLQLDNGDCLGILGRNGAGKTTLLHTLAGLHAAQSGQVKLDGHTLAGLSRRDIAQRLGLLGQDDDNLFPGTVMETALIGRHPFLSLWQNESAEDIAHAHSTLAALQLDGMQDRLVSTLSGGERRRLALATLFVQNPAVMLLDEPTNHLDLHHQVRLLEALQQRLDSGQHLAVIVMHDLNLALRYCNRLLLLYGNAEHELLAPAELTAAHASRLYDHDIIEINGPHGKLFHPG
ncbi:MAG: ABC transporter ATP-binding protein [Granulosicoccaceae bacterium]|jgi:iron complex transport system ATP-binding protein